MEILKTVFTQDENMSFSLSPRGTVQDIFIEVSPFGEIQLQGWQYQYKFPVPEEMNLAYPIILEINGVVKMEAGRYVCNVSGIRRMGINSSFLTNTNKTQSTGGKAMTKKATFGFILVNDKNHVFIDGTWLSGNLQDGTIIEKSREEIFNTFATTYPRPVKIFPVKKEDGVISTTGPAETI